MEKVILDAVEYLLKAINNIQDYRDFIYYKSEIVKAIFDIKNAIQKHLNINNLEENKTKSKISSILGLQFDYDSLINENDIKFFSDYEEKNQTIINKINNYFKKNETISHKKKSFKNTSIKKENNNNQKKIIKNLSECLNNKNINNNILKNFNSAKDLNHKKTNKNKLFNIRYLHNKEKNKNKKNIFEDEKQKEKIDIISEIIIKINNEDYIYDTLTKLYGNNITYKLLSNKVSDDLVEIVQNTIKEIERIHKKNIINKKEKAFREKYEVIKNNKNKFNVNTINPNNLKPNTINIKKYKSTNKFEYSEPYQEFDFKNSLRNQKQKKYNNIRINTNFYEEGFSDFTKTGKLKTNKIKDDSPFRMTYNPKPFISATCTYGKYFDEPLQKGGISKLDF